MSIDITHRIEADEGPLRVVHRGPFTDIQLSPGQYLTVHTPDDCDRLAAAVAEAKRLMSPQVDRLPGLPADLATGDPYCTSCGGDVRHTRDLDGNLIHTLTWEQLGAAPHDVTLSWRPKDAHGRYDAASAAEVALCATSHPSDGWLCTQTAGHAGEHSAPWRGDLLIRWGHQPAPTREVPATVLAAHPLDGAR